MEGGKMGAVGRTRIAARCCVGLGAGWERVISFIDVELPFRQDHATRINLIHQREVMGCDHDSGAQTVEFEEEREKPLGHGRIDVARRLVGQQDFGTIDQGAGDRRALLLSPGQDGWQDVDTLPETHPFEEFDDVVAIADFLLSPHAQRKRDVLVGGQVVEQAEILEHDADAPAQHRQLVAGYLRQVAPEHADQAAGRLQRHEEQPQECRLPGAGRPREELERLLRDVEGHVPKNLRAHPVTEADVFEMNQKETQIPCCAALATKVMRSSIATGLGRFEGRICEALTI
ncbi:protein of unknown function [Pseudorhizobium banfieldiae]|uniref:Uncharacterized protein n=1 Tax=Pseudorhizobium banfieldiae TaxID=1125847 RepID=L0NK09_9HYPH|nr:protein of unknown function [Pseudorhizobium banfieldiae]